ncbi:DUF3152 domain-containing protein [Streptomyces sp. NPDC001508]|uniref:DUF3152 domain-containing protein n=1 Tax=Streptomyces sp. NPDC001508 TaxID=3154656 RepID=UPI0033298467
MLARGVPRAVDGTGTQGVPWSPDGSPARGVPRSDDGTPGRGVPRLPDGTPGRGVPRLPDGTSAYGFPGLPDGAPARGVPRLADGTPARGVPRLPDGTPAYGFPGLPDGAPPRGVPRQGDGAPAPGVPRRADGTPARGVPRARGGHPEQREPGGGWGELRGRSGMGQGVAPGPAAAGTGAALPRQRPVPPGGPRQDYLDAFGADADPDVFAPRTKPGPRPAEPYAAAPVAGERDEDDEPPTGPPAPAKGGKGRAFTGIAAAAVTTVLAVIVAGQVTDGRDDTEAQPRSTTDQARDARDPASRADGRATASASPDVTPLTYEQKMDKKYPLGATLKAAGRFEAIPGIAKAPGTGQKYTYRVDVEQGLGLDGELFAQAVQKTLNDRRSWAHGGARTFERIHSGEPDFVITLASPGTTAEWCAKSGLDTTEDNVSCDSAATQRVMINAYRWAQGSTTYGDEIHAYRQMLINHEVGHRLGYGHVTCDKDGQPAPVMQQQTKFLDHDGIHCLANPWPYPGS